MTHLGWSRRDLLKRVGAAGLLAVPLASAGRLMAAARTALQTRRTLGPTDFATLHAICARLIPTDELGPGATEARAADYIDRALRGALAPSRAAYRAGLAAVDRAARQQFKTPFAKLTPAQQDGLLTAQQTTPFFAVVRAHTLQGTFCDPIYGGNADFVGWDLLGYPGVRLMVTEAEQSMSTPPTRQHAAAYDSGMFLKTGVDVD